MPDRKTPFELALDFTLKWEGGYVNNPADPGGATKFGITQKTLDAWIDSRKMPREDVRYLSLADAVAIYEQNYWSPAGCDSVGVPLAIVLFDTAVNFGVSGGRRILKAEMGLDPDKPVPVTEDVPMGDDLTLAVAICHHRAAKRQRLVEQNPRLRVFLKGWLNRDAALEKYVRSLMNGGGG